MDFENTDYNLILKKSTANIQTCLKLTEILKSTDRILCPESAVNLAQIYFELKKGGDLLLENIENVNVSDDMFKDLIYSITFNMDLIEEIAKLDLANRGGNLKMCLDNNGKTIEFSDFTEKADMIHMSFTDFDAKKSLKNRLRRI